MKDQYGTALLIQALKRAMIHQPYGGHYVENILHQERSPKQDHPPVQLKRQDLNRIRLEEPLLADLEYRRPRVEKNEILDHLEINCP